jgi:Mce-associated membrane protein
MSMIRRLRNRRPKIRAESEAATEQTDPEVTAVDAAVSEAGTEQTDPEAAAVDAAESEAGTKQIIPEAAAVDAAESEATDALADAAGTDVERGPSRLGLGWAAGIAAALALFAGGIGAGGYLALRAHQESQAVARNNAAALEAAKVCVAATQAPDTATMAASEQKIIDCGTDVYRTQALLYTNMLVQAYQAANVHVQVSDERAAVERNNSDGSVDVLVALRVKVSNDQSQNQETGYRLRVKMEPVDGQYKIARLDQVTK